MNCLLSENEINVIRVIGLSLAFFLTHKILKKKNILQLCKWFPGNSFSRLVLNNRIFGLFAEAQIYFK